MSNRTMAFARVSINELGGEAGSVHSEIVGDATAIEAILHSAAVTAAIPRDSVVIIAFILLCDISIAAYRYW